jgi:hypothetical protein
MNGGKDLLSKKKKRVLVRIPTGDTIAGHNLYSFLLFYVWQIKTINWNGDF